MANRGMHLTRRAFANDTASLDAEEALMVVYAVAGNIVVTDSCDIAGDYQVTSRAAPTPDVESVIVTGGSIGLKSGRLFYVRSHGKPNR